MTSVSVGSANIVDINNFIIHFNDNIVSKYKSVDCRNLAFCKFLNLRHASITDIETRSLLLLEYVDIAFSCIEFIDLFLNIYMQKVTADQS